MSCECNINLVKDIEAKYPAMKVFKLQVACGKCESLSESTKHTKKGEGFVAWGKKHCKNWRKENPDHE